MLGYSFLFSAQSSLSNKNVEFKRTKGVNQEVTKLHKIEEIKIRVALYWRKANITNGCADDINGFRRVLKKAHDSDLLFSFTKFKKALKSFCRTSFSDDCKNSLCSWQILTQLY